MTPYKTVIVEAGIGCGKSTLVRELGHALGDTTLVLMEPDETNNANPYLTDFYQDMARYAFTMQVHLLQARWKQHKLAQHHVLNDVGHAVLDRSFYGDTCFAKLQLGAGFLTQREFSTYSSLYHAMTASVLLPNVCVRLLVDPAIALGRIAKRAELRAGRKCEVSIELDYLQALDDEITAMCNVLQGMGVSVINMPWDMDRDSPEDRRTAVRALAERIKKMKTVNRFLDLHRRTT